MAAQENVALWHERDISYSSVERVIFPDSCAAGLHVPPTSARNGRSECVSENMKKNLGLSLGMWNSQTVLLALIRKGLTRTAGDLVQRMPCKRAVKHSGRDDADFLAQLMTDSDVLHLSGGIEKLCFRISSAAH